MGFANIVTGNLMPGNAQKTNPYQNLCASFTFTVEDGKAKGTSAETLKQVEKWVTAIIKNENEPFDYDPWITVTAEISKPNLRGDQPVQLSILLGNIKRNGQKLSAKSFVSALKAVAESKAYSMEMRFSDINEVMRND